MKTQTKRKLVKDPSRVLNINQIVKNSLGYVAFSSTLRGKLLQKQARRVIQLLRR